MSVFSALIILGMVSLPSTLQDECNTIPAKHNFDPAAYFTGDWYLTHSLWVDHKSDIPDQFVCSKSQTKVFSGIAQQIYITYYKGNFGIDEQFVSLDSFSKKIGKYIGISRKITSNGTPLSNFYSQTYTVTDTDYSNFAIVNKCIVYEGVTYSYYDIYNRKENGDVPPRAEIVLDILGFKLSDFVSSKNVDCKYNYLNSDTSKNNA